MTQFRCAEVQDRPQLKNIWKSAFGDSDEVIDIFLDHFGVSSGVVGECCGKIICAAYILPTDGLVSKAKERYSCSYLYAIAVEPDYRGNGLGKELTLAATHCARESGYEFTVLKPSDEGLFDFYRSLGFADFSLANELQLTSSQLKCSENNLKILPISPKEYGIIRERNLAGITHIAISDRAAAYQYKLGTLFCLQYEGVQYCAAAEESNGMLFIKELLVPDSLIMSAVSIISRELPAEIYRVAVPVFDRKSAVRTGMIFPNRDFTDDMPFLCLAYD